MQTMQRLSGQYSRFGSRRIRIFLNREGIQIGKARCARLWREAGLQGARQKKAASGGKRTAQTLPA